MSNVQEKRDRAYAELRELDYELYEEAAMTASCLELPLEMRAKVEYLLVCAYLKGMRRATP